MTGPHVAAAIAALCTAVAVCAAVTVVWVLGVRVMPVSSDSMAPTYVRGDHLLVARTGPDSVRRGAIVVIRTPASWREALARRRGTDTETSPEYMVKRVIGVGG